MPEVKRWGLNTLEGHLRPLVELGLKAVLLFGVPTEDVKVMLHLSLSVHILPSKMKRR